ncbi:hypothetical protein PoB_003956800 [Plakobranchus ocellatus]|uniref:Uncharacterized protein n=1 Tax=Plakobranchus ocellatus TaxID=259542 RepID=A0AAV4B2W2_9GAST|nr:hypothetical protein PoB_003956800 [Plakobranchus ocellatus]
MLRLPGSSRTAQFITTVKDSQLASHLSLEIFFGTSKEETTAEAVTVVFLTSGVVTTTLAPAFITKTVTSDAILFLAPKTQSLSFMLTCIQTAH